MIQINGFMGEIPVVHPHHLPVGGSQDCTNVRIESGVLSPYRRPRLDHTLPADALTIYRHGGVWLSWPGFVNVVPGPVAANRLYITGDGVPKLRVASTTYSLAVPTPVNRPKAELWTMNERLTIDGRVIALVHGRTRKSATLNCDLVVTVRANVATVTVSHAGLTEAQAIALVEGVTYSNTAASQADMVPSLKIVRLTKVQDSGGQTLDADQNKLGSDINNLSEVGATVRVAGTTLTHTFGTPDAQDTIDDAGWNDPPSVTATGLNPTYDFGDSPVLLFDNVDIDTIEAAQTIIKIVFTVEGLCNGKLDPDLMETITYAYTYVTDFEEESRPSLLATLLNWSPGQAVKISNMSPAPAGRAISQTRVYRSQTSLATGSTELFLIALIDEASTAYKDVVDITPLMDPLPSLQYDPPHASLEGIVAMPNGMMAAFVDRTLYFCEPYRPHAWPAPYALNVDAPIMGLAAAGGALIVVTERNPYVIQGNHPAVMAMERLEVNLPCIAKRSIVDMGYYAVYASTEGLVRVAPTTGADLVTRNLFTRKQWDEMKPASFRSSQHLDRYVISHDDNGLPVERRCTIIDLTGQLPFITRVEHSPKAFFFEQGVGILYWLDTDLRKIHEFDSVGGNLMPYRWRSKTFLTTMFKNYSCILIEGQLSSHRKRLMLNVYADGVLRATVHRFNQIVRLPDGFIAGKWEIEAKGTVEIVRITLGESPQQIAASAA